jgi:hypothetical protein
MSPALNIAGPRINPLARQSGPADVRPWSGDLNPADVAYHGALPIPQSPLPDAEFTWPSIRDTKDFEALSPLGKLQTGSVFLHEYERRMRKENYLAGLSDEDHEAAFGPKRAKFAAKLYESYFPQGSQMREAAILDATAGTPIEDGLAAAMEPHIQGEVYKTPSEMLLARNLYAQPYRAAAAAVDQWGDQVKRMEVAFSDWADFETVTASDQIKNVSESLDRKPVIDRSLSQDAQRQQLEEQMNRAAVDAGYALTLGRGPEGKTKISLSYIMQEIGRISDELPDDGPTRSLVATAAALRVRGKIEAVYGQDAAAHFWAKTQRGGALTRAGRAMEFLSADAKDLLESEKPLRWDMKRFGSLIGRIDQMGENPDADFLEELRSSLITPGGESEGDDVIDDQTLVPVRAALKKLKARDEFRNLARGTYEGVAFQPTLGHMIPDGMLDTVNYMTSFAIPYVGPASVGLAHAEDLREQITMANPDLDSDNARALSLLGGGLSVAIERTPGGRYLGARVGAGPMKNFFASMAVETAEEVVQAVSDRSILMAAQAADTGETPDFGDEVARMWHSWFARQGTIDPETGRGELTWAGLASSQLTTTAVIMAPLAAFGAGKIALTEDSYRDFAEQLSEPDMLEAWGVSDVDALRISEIADPFARVDAYREAEKDANTPAAAEARERIAARIPEHVDAPKNQGQTGDASSGEEVISSVSSTEGAPEKGASSAGLAKSPHQALEAGANIFAQPAEGERVQLKTGAEIEAAQSRGDAIIAEFVPSIVERDGKFTVTTDAGEKIEAESYEGAKAVQSRAKNQKSRDAEREATRMAMDHFTEARKAQGVEAEFDLMEMPLPFRERVQREVDADRTAGQLAPGLPALARSYDALKEASANAMAEGNQTLAESHLSDAEKAKRGDVAGIQATIQGETTVRKEDRVFKYSHGGTTEEYTDRIAVHVAKVALGAPPTVVVEEAGHQYFDAGIEDRGADFFNEMLGLKREVEAATGGSTHGDTERGVKEWFSSEVNKYAAVRTEQDRSKIPRRLREIFDAILDYVGEVLTRWGVIQTAMREGSISPKFEEHMLRTLGMDVETVAAMSGIEMTDDVIDSFASLMPDAEVETSTEEIIARLTDRQKQQLLDLVVLDDPGRAEYFAANRVPDSVVDAMLLLEPDSREAHHEMVRRSRAEDSAAAGEGFTNLTIAEALTKAGGIKHWKDLKADGETLWKEFKDLQTETGKRPDGKKPFYHVFRQGRLTPDGALEAINEQGFEFGTIVEMIDAMNDYAGGADVRGTKANQDQASSDQAFSLGRAPDSLGFYSALERAIEDRMPVRASAQQILGIIDPAKGGVKKAEIDWMGIREWLSDRKSVEKADALEFIAQNKVQLREVRNFQNEGIQGEEKARLVAWLDRKFKSLGVELTGGDFYSNSADFHDDYRRGGDSRSFALENLRDNGVPHGEVAKLAVELDDEIDVERPTKYDRYTLPGGTNPREFLLTLPTTDATIDSWIEVYDDSDEINGTVWRGRFSKLAPMTGGLGSAGRTKEEAMQKSREIIRDDARREGYRSTHGDEWGEQNIAVWVRSKDRQTATGQRAFHVEEIQSDWAGDINKKGARDEAEVKRLEDEASAVLTEYLAIEEAASKREYSGIANGDIKAELEAFPPQEKQKWADLKNRESDLRQKINAARDAAPPMPWSKTYHELGFKRALRIAAEEGYDVLTWSTGKQQIDLYTENLRQNVDRIEWEKTEDTEPNPEWGEPEKYLGTQSVYITVNGDQKIGYLPLTGEAQLGQLSGETLDSTVGKTIANQIRESKELSGVIEGDDLSIGGHFHKLMYDQMLPSFAGKFTKKWGGKVGTAEVGADPYSGDRSQEDQDVALLDELGVKPTGKHSATVHSLPITPAMREASAEGFASFSLGVMPEQDSAHREAVESGDMETAQRMVNSAVGEIGIDEVRAAVDGALEMYEAVGLRSIDESVESVPDIWDTPRPSFTWEFDEEMGNYQFPSETQSGVVSAIDPNHINNIGKYFGNVVLVVGGDKADLEVWQADENEISIEAGSAEVYERFSKEWHPVHGTKFYPYNPPATYDSSGNLIPLSQRLNPASDSISYSMGSPAGDAARLLREALKPKPKREKVRMFKDTLDKMKARIRADKAGIRKDAKDWRTQLVEDLSTLAWLRRGLPLEVRGKLTGDVKAAKIVTQAARQKFLDERLEKASEIYEEHLKKTGLEEVEKLFAKTENKITDSRQNKGKLTAAGAEFFEMVRGVATMTPGAVQKRLDAINAVLEQDATGNEDADEQAALFDEWEALTTVGAIKTLTADEIDAALQWMTGAFVEFKSRRQAIEQLRRETLAAEIADNVEATGKPRPGVNEADDASRKTGLAKGAQSAKSFAAQLFDFSQLLETVFPGSESAKRAGRKSKDIVNAATDRALDARRRFDTFARDVFGITGKGGKSLLRVRLNALAEPIKKTGVMWWSSKGVKQRFDLDQARRIANEVKTHGLKPHQVSAVQAAWAEHEELGEELERQVAANEPGAAVRLAGWNRRTGIDVDLPGASLEEKTYSQFEALYHWLLLEQAQYLEQSERMGFGPEAKAQLDAFLTPETKRLGRFMQHEMLQQYPELNAVHDRIHGTKLPSIENYFPGVFQTFGEDKSIEPFGAEHALAGLRGAGFTKGRVKHGAKPRTISALAIFDGHMEASGYYIEAAEFVRDLRAVYTSPKLKESVTAVYGQERARSLGQWVQIFESAGPVRQEIQTLDSRALSKIRSNLTLAALAFNVGTTAVQGSNLIAAAQHTSTRKLFGALGRLALNWPLLGKRIKQVWTSADIGRRMESGINPEMAREMKQALGVSKPWQRRMYAMAKRAGFSDKLAAKAAIEFSEPFKAEAVAGMKFIAGADSASLAFSFALAYEAHYHDAIKRGANETAANAFAERQVSKGITDSAQPMNFANLSLMENANMNGWAKLFGYMFVSDPRRKLANMMAANVMAKQRTGSKRDAAKMTLLMLIAYPALEWALRGAAALAIKDDDPDEAFDPMKLLQAIGVNQASGIPIFGPIFEMAMQEKLQGRAYTRNPITQVYQSLRYAGNDMEDFNEAVEDGDILEAFEEGGRVLRAGGSAIYGPVGGIGNFISQGAQAADNLDRSDD